MYTESHPWATSLQKIVFIIIWKVAGKLVRPKNMTVGSKSVTGSWDKASLYALWTRVSSGTGLIRDVVVASAVSVCVSDLCFGLVFHGHLLMDSGVETPWN
jgi:hypothetical protein